MTSRGKDSSKWETFRPQQLFKTCGKETGLTEKGGAKKTERAEACIRAKGKEGATTWEATQCC